MEKNAEKLKEIKDRVNGKGVGIYDGVCQMHDNKWLIAQAEKLEKIDNLWCDIEFNESHLKPSDFYGKVQDILAGENEE